MIFEIEGQQVELIYADTDKVTVVAEKDGILTLRISPLLPQYELNQFVKLFKRRKQKQQRTIGFDGDYVTIFDTRFPVRYLDSSSSKGYLADGIISAPFNFKHKIDNRLFIEDFKIYLLKEHIIKSLSKWEEKTNLFIAHNKFRKLKTNLYTSCLQSNTITWNTKLMDFNQETIDYVVLDGLLGLSSVTDNQSDRLKDKYVANCRFYQKSITHEPAQPNSYD
ncbi:YgjP-like metallopeptidase domain-containing protein [Sphingobacterium hungaricum]|uniref:YgjP-like metallopeptidase domain-containing protein n=1 Tax=Sphingobacterium hungaricum TaxID=2082723 RepID=A0A928UVU9_9SPHI|nr:YgjP-like metallopeptidase domain-containing protein [Sphingobacterium hungaricum]MBE8712235.1 hypothetical protein [Sphingobacterium hungaricum]